MSAQPITLQGTDVILARDAVIEHTKRLKEQVDEAIARNGTAAYLGPLLEWYQDLERRLTLSAPL